MLKESMTVTNLGYRKVYFKIYGSLNMLYCYFWDFGFSNLRMTFAKKLFGTETWNPSSFTLG